MTQASFYSRFVKPSCSFLLGLLMLVISSPVFILTALLLFLFNRGRVFFIQERVGYHESLFRLIKFRSLRDRKGADGKQLPDRERQFALGNFLRNFHIDELPQLFNVLKGELVLVGPRPLLKEYLPYYSAKQRQRHEQKPGLTGLAQIMGGNRLEWNQRLRLDTFYAQHCSLALDAWIIYRTIIYFFSKRIKANEKEIFSESFIASKAPVNHSA
jgi:lipopolysaccharide/colanic/teichoic acid biosynthesis glycosyltransferase